MRQPGSAIKPLSYLAALGKGLQPNTLVMDEPITLPPIGGGRAREQDYWTPKNYDGGVGRHSDACAARWRIRAISPPSHLLDGGIEKTPEASLDRLCELAVEAQIYRECVRYYPFVLGAQPVRPIDLAAFYAAIANEGLRPTPHADRLDRARRTNDLSASADRVGARSARSTAPRSTSSRPCCRACWRAARRARSRALRPMSPARPAPRDDENDAWFVGFTNDVTVAVWVGYDNADGKRRTLGGGATGGGVAVPIFEPIIQAVWANVAPKTALAPPSPEAKRQLSVQVDRPRVRRSARGRRQSDHRMLPDRRHGQVLDTQYRLVSREERLRGA